MTKETYLKGLQAILERNDKQIAIEELEEIKTEIENVDLFNTYFFDKHFKSPLEVKNSILIILDNHISELKGENNEH